MKPRYFIDCGWETTTGYAYSEQAALAMLRRKRLIRGVRISPLYWWGTCYSFQLTARANVSKVNAALTGLDLTQRRFDWLTRHDGRWKGPKA